VSTPTRIILREDELPRQRYNIQADMPRLPRPVLERYREVRFDLFHAGWPYSELLGAIGKAFPNVYLNMCWAWGMNPAQMERILYRVARRALVPLRAGQDRGEGAAGARHRADGMPDAHAGATRL
jgi:hypothetical protein